MTGSRLPRELLAKLPEHGAPTRVPVIWHHIVNCADPDGCVRLSDPRLSAKLRDEHPSPSDVQMRTAVAWLCKHKLLVKLAPTADAYEGPGSYRIARTLRPGDASDLVVVAMWLAEDILNDELAEETAQWIAGIWAVRDTGPGGTETARKVRPGLSKLSAEARQHYTGTLMNALRQRMWIESARDGSLFAGPRLRNRHQVAEPPRRSKIIDRGF